MNVFNHREWNLMNHGYLSKNDASNEHLEKKMPKNVSGLNRDPQIPRNTHAARIKTIGSIGIPSFDPCREVFFLRNIGI